MKVELQITYTTTGSVSYRRKDTVEHNSDEWREALVHMMEQFSEAQANDPYANIALTQRPAQQES